MIVYNMFLKMMSYDIRGRYCIEILFSIDGSEKYSQCWMGKLYDKDIGKDVYWYGLTPDDKNAYCYVSFDDFMSAEVFKGKSLVEIWDIVRILEIDGCDPEERIKFYTE